MSVIYYKLSQFVKTQNPKTELFQVATIFNPHWPTVCGNRSWMTFCG